MNFYRKASCPFRFRKCNISLQKVAGKKVEGKGKRLFSCIELNQLTVIVAVNPAAVNFAKIAVLAANPVDVAAPIPEPPKL